MPREFSTLSFVTIMIDSGLGVKKQAIIRLTRLSFTLKTAAVTLSGVANSS